MVGVQRMVDDEELPDPPNEAFSDLRTYEVENCWLKQASPEEQAGAMVLWFLARFCDPDAETPYMSSEGGYIWVHGGPYDATEQIEGRFDEIASEDAIKLAVEKVEDSGIYDWAPTSLTYLDEADDVFIDDRNEPTKRCEERIRRVLAVLALTGEDEAIETARNLAYAAVISALEAFLHETMSYWVSSRDEVVQAIITQHPQFKDQKIVLGKIYDTHASLEKQVKAHLRRVVWHRDEDVVALFKHGLGIEVGFHRFKDEISIRHHIIHRFSQDSNGDPIVVEDGDVRALAEKVVAFANEIDAKTAETFVRVVDKRDKAIDVSG